MARKLVGNAFKISEQEAAGYSYPRKPRGRMRSNPGVRHIAAINGPGAYRKKVTAREAMSGLKTPTQRANRARQALPPRSNKMNYHGTRKSPTPAQRAARARFAAMARSGAFKKNAVAKTRTMTRKPKGRTKSRTSAKTRQYGAPLSPRRIIDVGPASQYPKTRVPSRSGTTKKMGRTAIGGAGAISRKRSASRSRKAAQAKTLKMKTRQGPKQIRTVKMKTAAPKAKSAKRGAAKSAIDRAIKLIQQGKYPIGKGINDEVRVAAYAALGKRPKKKTTKKTPARRAATPKGKKMAKKTTRRKASRRRQTPAQRAASKRNIKKAQAARRKKTARKRPATKRKTTARRRSGGARKARRSPAQKAASKRNIKKAQAARRKKSSRKSPARRKTSSRKSPARRKSTRKTAARRKSTGRATPKQLAALKKARAARKRYLAMGKTRGRKPSTRTRKRYAAKRRVRKNPGYRRNYRRNFGGGTLMGALKKGGTIGVGFMAHKALTHIVNTMFFDQLLIPKAAEVAAASATTAEEATQAAQGIGELAGTMRSAIGGGVVAAVGVWLTNKFVQDRQTAELISGGMVASFVHGVLVSTLESLAPDVAPMLSGDSTAAKLSAMYGVGASIEPMYAPIDGMGEYFESGVSGYGEYFESGVSGLGANYTSNPDMFQAAAGYGEAYQAAAGYGSNHVDPMSNLENELTAVEAAAGVGVAPYEASAGYGEYFESGVSGFGAVDTVPKASTWIPGTTDPQLWAGVRGVTEGQASTAMVPAGVLQTAGGAGILG